MAKRHETIVFNDIYCVGLTLRKGEKDGESKLFIGLTHKDGPTTLCINFKYFADIFGAEMDPENVFTAETAPAEDTGAAVLKKAAAFEDWCKTEGVKPGDSLFADALALALHNHGHRST